MPPTQVSLFDTTHDAPPAPAPAPRKPDLAGRLTHVIAERPDGRLTWFAGRIETPDGETHTIAGKCPAVPPLEADLSLFGSWKTHDRFGRQFAFVACEIKLPTTEDGVLRFLETLPGIGPRRARQIVDAYGAESITRIQTDPHALDFLRGVGAKTASRILADLTNRESDINVEQRLCAMGFGDRTREKIRDVFGDALPAILETNPYRLVEVDRVGFHQVDNAVMAVGQIAPDSPFRAAAATVQGLKNAAQSGHTWLSHHMLAREIDQLKLSATIPEGARLAGIEQAIADASIVRVSAISPSLSVPLCLCGESPPPGSPDGLALADLAQAEEFVASRLRDLRTDNVAFGNLAAVPGDILDALTEEQNQALLNAVNERVSVLTGGPGTGKTYTTRAIIEAVGKKNIQIVAPTGKAAKRASEMSGTEAMTIHRFVGSLLSGAIEDEPRVIICDEFSMVSIDILAMLFRALTRDDTRLVIVGDVDQLPSVGPGQCLRDILDSAAIPTVRLTTIQRQAEGSRIITNAHRLNVGLPMDHSRATAGDWFFLQGDDPATLARTILAAARRAVTAWGYDVRADVQVLAGMRLGPLGVVALNEIFREEFNPPAADKPEIVDGKGVSQFRQGDKVLITKNEYNLGVVNGDVGVVTAVHPYNPDARDEEGKFVPASIVISFDDGRVVIVEGEDMRIVTQAWACTVHKYQGSEIPCLIMVCHSSMWWACQRPLLYTGITRASERVVLAGNAKGIAQATRNIAPNARFTRLKALLQ